MSGSHEDPMASKKRIIDRESEYQKIRHNI